MTLFLTIKENFLIHLINGTKKEEYRGFTRYNLKKICNLDADGQFLSIKEFEKVRFYTGKYLKGTRSFAEFEVEKIEVQEVDFDTENEYMEFVIYIGNLLVNNYYLTVKFNAESEQEEELTQQP